ncbi:MAG: PAS domain-containing protein [Bryobacteraceae bacterium]
MDGTTDNPVQVHPETQATIDTLRLRIRSPEHKLAAATSQAAHANESGQFTAVTDSPQRERNLQETDTNLRAIYQGARSYIGLLRPDGTLLDTNPASLEFAGLNQADVLGRPFWETPWFTATPGASETLREGIRLAAAGEFVRYDIDLFKPSGEHASFDFSLSPVKNECGDVVMIVPEARDITERKQAERELRKSQERIRMTQTTAAVGSWDWDLVTNQVEWSRELFDVLDVPPDVQPSLELWEQIVHPEDRGLVYSQVSQVLESGTILDTEFRILSPNGTTRWISTLGRVLRNEAGKAVRIFGLNVDLTARKRGEQRAAVLLRLEDATRSLTDPHEITQTAARLVGEHLNVNRCAYADVEEDEDTFNLAGDFNRGVPSIVGRYTFAQFGAECLRLMRLGQPYIVDDSECDGRTEAVRDAYRQTYIRSVICVPLLKRGRFAAAMAVHAVTPRQWRTDEVELLQLVANRCWESIERARAETELRNQWHTFDTLISNVPDLMCTFDAEGRFTYANAALLDVWQRSLPDIIGKNTFEIGNPVELAHRLQSELREVIRTVQSVRNYTPFTSASGATRTYEYIFSPVVSSRGLVEAVTCSARDITERERIELALADSQQRLQQIFRQAPVAIVVLRGRNLVIELANPFYEAMVQRKNLVGLPLASAIPDVGRHVWDAFDQVLDTGEPFVAHELLVAFDQNGDGRPEDHWFNVVYHPLRESDDQISGVVAVCSEVTTQVIARKELEKANRELEEFAYVSSHDLQEPLRMVGIYTEMLLLRYLPDNAQAKEFGAFIQQGVQRIEQLIQDLLSYSRTIHADSTDLGTADLNESCRQACSTMDVRIEETGAQVTVSTLPRVRGDASQWALVFQNLLSNSLKYRYPHVPPVIQISAEKSRDNWLITIRDNGIGFEQQYADRIFMLFKRLHKGEYPGTGLGLAICQRIVERYGSSIWAEGRPGEGATFYISAPEG